MGYFQRRTSCATAMSRVFAVCGMPGSGKGEFAALLEQNGIPNVSMGDMIRKEVKHRGLEESPMIFGQIASELRSEFGPQVLADRLVDAVNELMETNTIVLIEGMRGTDEYDVFISEWGQSFSTIAIETDTEIRFERIQSRGRSEDGDRAAFDVRNQRESSWGLESLIQDADVIFNNDKTIEEFSTTVNAWLNEISDANES